MKAPDSPPSIHGHAILKQLAATPMSRAAIAAHADAEYGANARYHTCDTRDLCFDALFDLLAARGKIIADGALWSTETAKVRGDA